MPQHIIDRLQLKETRHWFGISRKFGIMVYDYKDGILCGMMDSTGGPSDKVLFVRRNFMAASTKFIQMTATFVETAEIGVIDKILTERLPRISLIV